MCVLFGIVYECAILWVGVGNVRKTKLRISRDSFMMMVKERYVGFVSNIRTSRYTFFLFFFK